MLQLRYSITLTHSQLEKSPHPNPPPEYREREQERIIPSPGTPGAFSKCERPVHCAYIALNSIPVN